MRINSIVLERNWKQKQKVSKYAILAHNRCDCWQNVFSPPSAVGLGSSRTSLYLSESMYILHPRTMIPEAVFREFPAETRRKHTVSDRNPLENTRNSTQESGDRIRLPVLPGSCRFRAEPDKSGHRIRSPEYCFHVPSISGVFLRDPARTFRPGALCCII